MPGLPGSSREKDIKTCIESIEMKPDLVRIYPTLVIKDTDLFDMYEKGSYKPLALEEAVEISAYMYALYSVNNINAIRIGLQNTDSIKSGEDVKAGPFHPAFRQLVEERIYYNTLESKLKGLDLKGESIAIHAPLKLISNIAGHKKKNIKHLKDEFLIKAISFKEKNNDIIEIYHNDKRLFSFHKTEIFQNYLNMQQGDSCF